MAARAFEIGFFLPVYEEVPVCALELVPLQGDVQKSFWHAFAL